MKKDAIYSIAQHQWVEREAKTTLNLNEDELMLRAGKAAFEKIAEKFPTIKTIAIFCGSGNNAGDGMVLARFASQAGWSVYLHRDEHVPLKTVASQRAFEALDKENIHFTSLDAPLNEAVALVVDALFGIGFLHEVKNPYSTVIQRLNQTGLPIVALDIPSGLNADTGVICAACIHAQLTLTFIGLKLGLFTGEGPDVAGEIILISLGLDSYLETVSPYVKILALDTLKQVLTPRHKNSHKGDFGHVLVVGGGIGMGGAAYMAAAAAMRIGAGVVHVAIHPQYAIGVWQNLPEVMVHPIGDMQELQSLLLRCDVCVLGPGLGEDVWAKQVFDAVIGVSKPLIVDADALKWLAASPFHNQQWILTPHPGEAGTLLGITSHEIQYNRYQAIQQMVDQYGGVVVLKGRGSLIAHQKERMLCQEGSPAMAVAGMGDILSGLIAGLVAQGIEPFIAAQLGVVLHAKAGEVLEKAEGTRGALALDFLPYIRKLVNS